MGKLFDTIKSAAGEAVDEARKTAGSAFNQALESSKQKLGEIATKPKAEYHVVDCENNTADIEKTVEMINGLMEQYDKVMISSTIQTTDGKVVFIVKVVK